MKKILMICCGVALLVAGCRKGTPEVPVTKMEFDPSSVKLFVGEEQPVSVKCYPADATNLDQLTVSVADPTIAQFENGKLLARKGGYTRLDAVCGTAKAAAVVQVYFGYFTKGGQRYPVDEANGHIFMESEPTPQELDMTLTCLVGNGDTQNFWFMMGYDKLGKTIDFMKDMENCLVSVQKNNNEDGYCVPYYSEDLGRPVVKLADWGDTDATLTKGTLKVSQVETGVFKVEADFALSNGYTFTADWEGPASMKTEG